uniref:Uncharacterized protein n=1 Tax=Zooxanthella nutricula TaxID=1333877 RepID=A0A7S2IY14_9DINO|mmetsp:Transcript_23776/g.71433  ORF Transcript_23776/g.71433 Transcript_23776/m.71433 type:complete len:193 (+) Transcript_23776:120-698(+)
MSRSLRCPRMADAGAPLSKKRPTMSYTSAKAPSSLPSWGLDTVLMLTSSSDSGGSALASGAAVQDPRKLNLPCAGSGAWAPLAAWPAAVEALLRRAAPATAESAADLPVDEALTGGNKRARFPVVWLAAAAASLRCGDAGEGGEAGVEAPELAAALEALGASCRRVGVKGDRGRLGATVEGVDGSEGKVGNA